MASLVPRSGLLGRRLAAHLLRRAKFGPQRAEIDLLSGKSADEAVELLMNFPPLPAHPVDPATGLTWVINGRSGTNTPTDELKLIVGSWWLHQLFDPNLPLSSMQKIVFFLHTSFVTGLNVVEYSESHYYTIRLLMFYADKSYKDLAKKICLDNGMNDFLDIGESEKDNPNENFMREFLELFTIGKGPQIGEGDYTTFTEQDVMEGARLMTGFRRNDDWFNPLYFDPDHGMPRAKPDIERHDITDKMFSPAFGNTVITGRLTAQGMIDEVSDLVDMIFGQIATAREIVRRMYRFFVKYEISQEVDDDIITPLANDLFNNNYVLVPVIKKLLKSQHFYDEDNNDNTDEIIGSLIKSPLELQTGIIRYFNIPIPDPVTDPFTAYVSFYRWGMQKPLSAACFDLFDPPEVAGYQPIFQSPEFNRLWISSKSLPARYQMVEDHLFGPDLTKINVIAFVNDSAQITDYMGSDPQGVAGPHPGARIATHLIQELVDYLLPEGIDQARFDYLLNEILLDNLTELNWMFEWDSYVASGDDSNVRPQIEKLVRAILQSPEYQLG